MITALLSMYALRYPSVLVYMLQSAEYQVGPYLRWYWRTNNFNLVTKRRVLVRTKAARLLLLAMTTGMLAQIGAGILLIILHIRGGVDYGLALIISYPLVWGHLIVVPLLLGRWFIIGPKEQRLISQSEKIFAAHKGVKIAVAGSYGKTTMKELLVTVLSEGKKVAATPANKNVAVSHAQFAQTLDGNEDVVIIEYGEGRPGDVPRFIKTTHPDIGIITGLAPAHLDQYKTLAAAGADIFKLAEDVSSQKLYVNAESPLAEPFIKPDYQTYSRSGALGWEVQEVKLGLEGTTFTLKKGKQSMELTSGLLGEHQIGPLALVAALADQLGLTKKQIQAGVQHTKPFEHRMQPYELKGAWVIDDTYNGNIDGMKAGLKLLAALPAKRKLYVTPGLVDQGPETERVHLELGQAIAAAKPDLVVLMHNSVTDFIEKGLTDYKGEVMIEDEPLRFYTNLDQFVAAGDLVLMQNDWTDNYS